MSKQVSKKWNKISVLYEQFCKGYQGLDFSDGAKLAMYDFESKGIRIENTDKINGYMMGKKLMDITIAMWKEDIAKGLLTISELKTEYPSWFLNRVGIS